MSSTVETGGTGSMVFPVGSQIQDSIQQRSCRANPDLDSITCQGSGVTFPTHHTPCRNPSIKDCLRGAWSICQSCLHRLLFKSCPFTPSVSLDFVKVTHVPYRKCSWFWLGISNICWAAAAIIVLLPLTLLRTSK